MDRTPGDSSRPPIPNHGSYRGQCFGDCRPALVRHASLMKTMTSDVPTDTEKSKEKLDTDFLPIVRSGGWADIGFRRSMEDAYVCCDNFIHEYGLKNLEEGPSAFYGVFDGHGGKHAADFACSNLLKFILEDDEFPREMEKVISSAFLQTDAAFAEACSLDSALDSGTTALAALVVGRLLVVANAGDCRAVLSRRGKAIELSQDHKPSSLEEKLRIESSGGYIYDGYLNGQLNVARALGDWHMEGLKIPNGSGLSPLSAQPDIMLTTLTQEDEFLIIGCDGLWDVFRSQNAIDFARRKLQEHNDPQLCCKELVTEALKRRSGDNVAVVIVCFQAAPPPNLVAPRGRVQRSISAEGLKELQGFLDSLGN